MIYLTHCDAIPSTTVDRYLDALDGDIDSYISIIPLFLNWKASLMLSLIAVLNNARFIVYEHVRLSIVNCPYFMLERHVAISLQLYLAACLLLMNWAQSSTRFLFWTSGGCCLAMIHAGV